MQIHELNNYSGQLDSSAYLGVDNGADTGKVSVPELLQDVNNEIAQTDSALNARIDNAVNTLNARIDNIIAGGDAPSEAEIVDARQGASDLGGVAYPSLGDAIRGQVSTIVSDIGLHSAENVPLTFTDGYVVINNKISASGGWSISQKIPVKAGYKANVYTALTETAQVAIFDADDVCLKAYTLDDGTFDFGWYYSFEFVCPPQSSYLQFSCVTDSKARAYANLTYSDISDKLNRFYTAADAKKGVIIDDNGELILTDQDITLIKDQPSYTWTADKVIINGTIYNSNGWKITNYIPVKPNMKLEIITGLTGSGAIAFYDSDLNYVADSNYVIADGTKIAGNLYKFSLTAPAGAEHVIVSCINAEISNVSIDLYGTITDYIDIYGSRNETNPLEQKNILVFGDSISDNSYHTPGGAAWNKWASYLANELGFNLTNNSYHATGFVADTSTPDRSRTLPKRVVQYTSADSFDMIIIFMGINDFIHAEPFGTSADVDYDTYIGAAMRYCLDYLIDTFPGAKLLGILPLQYTGKNLVYNGMNLAGYVEKFKEVYDDYSVPTLNLYNEGGFRTWNNTFRNEFSMLADDGTGTLFHDGLHPNEDWDHGYLSPKIKDFLEANA